MIRFKHPMPVVRSAVRIAPHRLCGDNWTRLRNGHIQSHPMCAMCGGLGEEVHHMVPRSMAPHMCLDPHNLQTLCVRCHRAHHRGSHISRP